MIPDYKGITASQYEAELQKAGITSYEMIAQKSASSGTPNSVIMIQVDGKNVNPGDNFNNTDGKKLYVYFLSKDAEIITEPPTEAPTEAPTEPPTDAPTEAPTEAPPEAPTESQEATQPEQNDGNQPEFG